METPPETSSESSSDYSLEAAQAFLADAANTLAISKDRHTRLRLPTHSQQIAVPLERDDGSLDILDGYRIRYDNTRGPFLGPHRYRSELNGNSCTGIAAATTVSAAIADVPFGGAAGGVAVDPAALSRGERKRLTRTYAERIVGIGPHDDIIIPGVGVDGSTMASFADAISTRIDGPYRATTAGKPPAIGGHAGLDSAVEHSISLAVEEVLEMEMNRSLADSTVAVYGIDGVGSATAHLLDSWDASVIAMANDRAGLTDSDGLDAGTITNHLNTNQLHATTAAEDETIIGTEDVLEWDADALVLSTPGILSAQKAQNVEAPLVIEGTYGAISPDGQRVLEERDITVVPAVLATVGGVIAAYLEWAQSLGRDHWSDAQVRNELSYAITAAWDDVQTRRAIDDSTLTEAAYSVGLSRLVDAHEVVR